MATQSLQPLAREVRRPVLHAATTLNQLPRNFLLALQAGWEIIGEASRLTGDHRRRRGRIVLGKDHRLIQVNYTVTQRAGFRFGRPHLI
jgi:hypothetical protein